MGASKKQKILRETLTNKFFDGASTPDLLARPCPHCHSEEVTISHQYETKNNGERTLYSCLDCGASFSQTYGSPIAGLTTPLSEIIKVLKARMEGMGLNATAKTFKISKNTIINWEKRLASLQNTLFLYALVHDFLQLIIEGDELYTKVNRNTEPSESEGWTIVLMDRASRFIWTLQCGRKQRRLFLEAVVTLMDVFERSESLAVFTDGERRYSQLLFDICHEIVRDGRKGRPPKVLPKELVIRLKNKSSKRRDSQGKLQKVETPKPEHPETTFSPDKQEVHANHVEAFNSSLRRYLSAFRRRTNTYAKSSFGLQRMLDIFWMVHNFVRPHFTTRVVPAVAIGIVEKGFTWEELLQIRILF